tara:strand:+ start:72398 stop:73537 length:1140 start_codon:yes stop_codon:yes gene_type:complete
MSDCLDDILEETTSDKTEDKKIEVVEKKEAPKEEKQAKYRSGVGVDIGTSNIVVSRQTEDGKFVSRYHRNMLFPLDISEEAVDLLDKSDYLYVKVNNKFFVVGEDALNLVNAIGKGEIVRPMKDGIMNPSLKESSELLFYIIKAVVGDPIIENEPLRYSIPANPVDSDIDNIFHKMILNNFFKKLGYDPKPVNEAMCIAYDCNPVLKDEEDEIALSGCVCSCGAGMWNLALCYKGLSVVEFSCTKSGDHLDSEVSRMTGTPISKVIKTKEKKLDLRNVDFDDRVQAALSIYYDDMIDRMVQHISNQFSNQNSDMDGKIEIVVAGGTSMAPGFCERLEEAVERADFPFEVYRIRHSDNPFYSVSQGACIRAQADYAKTQK